jgi:hypothetical protein
MYINYKSYFSLEEFEADMPSGGLVEGTMPTMSLAHINNAFEKICGAVEHAFVHSGLVDHEINGITFSQEDVSGVACLYIDEKLKVPYLIDEMLKRFSAVVHVFNGKIMSNENTSGEQLSANAAVMHVHTAESVFVAFCPIDPVNRTFNRAALQPVTQPISGNLARAVPVRH